MKYTNDTKGQVKRNGIRIAVLLILCPFFLMAALLGPVILIHPDRWDFALRVLPYILGIVAVWFIIAFFCNTVIIRRIMKARKLSRKDNQRVYTILENLCSSIGMKTPRINVVESDGLNSFSSGINGNSYTVTLTTGLVNKLDDEELAAVMSHEIAHIRSKDTSMLMTCIVFVGLPNFFLNFLVSAMQASHSIIFREDEEETESRNPIGKVFVNILLGLFILVASVFTAICYVLSLLNRIVIRKKRVYLADADGAQLCGNTEAMVSALQKISENPAFADVRRRDVSPLFIYYNAPDDGFLRKIQNRMFSTHPNVEKRIKNLNAGASSPQAPSVQAP